MAASMTQCSCAWRGCGKQFAARTADVARGWGRFCSKACKAKEQESRTGQNRAYVVRGGGQQMSAFERDLLDHEAALNSMSDTEYGASDGGSHERP